MGIFSIIGRTPLVEIKKIWDPDKTGIRILAKLEDSNPGGSVKDRPAYWMLKTAVAEGVLTPDKIILEPTSGNTGIGLAAIGAAMGFRVKLTMPACVSEERRAILAALGAELELTPGCEKTDGAIRRAHKIMETEGDRFFMPNQFANDANWRAHYETTAPEVVQDTGGLFCRGHGNIRHPHGLFPLFQRTPRKDKGHRTGTGLQPPHPGAEKHERGHCTRHL